MTRAELIKKWDRYRQELRHKVFHGDLTADDDYQQRRVARALDLAELAAVFCSDLRELEDAK